VSINVEVEQTRVEGDGENVYLVETSLNDQTLDGHVPHLDNIVFYDNVDESSREELDGDEEDGNQDGGDNSIGGLDEGD